MGLGGEQRLHSASWLRVEGLVRMKRIHVGFPDLSVLALSSGNLLNIQLHNQP